MRRFAILVMTAGAALGATAEHAAAQFLDRHVIGFQEAYNFGADFNYHRDFSHPGCSQGFTVIEGQGTLDDLSRLGIRVYVNCRTSAAGNRVTFNAIDLIRLNIGWMVMQTDILTSADDRNTHVTNLIVPTMGQTRPLTRVRLTVNAFHEVRADIKVTIARLERVTKRPPFPQCVPRPGPDDTPFEGSLYGSYFKCSGNKDCKDGYVCALQCGNRCVKPLLPF